MPLSRRATLLGLAMGGGFVSALGKTRFAWADARTQQRLIVILQRGAQDGMSAVVPYGDPNLVKLRPALIPPAPGQPGGMFDLGGFYGLSPYFPNLAAMYRAGELLAIHAVAGPYRTRSHFEAQDLLQLGAPNDETSITSGWLNRVLAELPAHKGGLPLGLAAGIGMPLLLQGRIASGSFAPEHMATPSPDLAARIASLNAHDPLLGPAISEGMRARRFDAAVMGRDGAPGKAARGHAGFPGLATQIGQLLAAAHGPRLAVFELEGWDTHGNQVNGLKGPMTGLDAGLFNLKAALGPAWARTCVLVVTEFGRTARMNGTMGTDHGTAAAALVLGGAVQGGRVAAAWPGLAPAQLFENRDLAPTRDIRSVAKGMLAQHLGLGRAALARVFPGSASAAPMSGIIRTG